MPLGKSREIDLEQEESTNAPGQGTKKKGERDVPI